MSAWGKIEQPEPVNLKDIMSEQLAKDFQSKGDEDVALKLQKELNEDGGGEVTEDVSEEASCSTLPDELPIELDGNCDNDAVIAALLQQEFDREHNKALERTEGFLNSKSKIGISFSNYRRSDVDYGNDSEEEDEAVDPRDQKDWDRFDSVNRHFSSMPPCGYKVQSDGSMLTKHDINMTGRRNACRLMSFPPDYETGDTAASDIKLSNSVFNTLKIFSKNEQKRGAKHQDKKEDRATTNHVIDAHTAEMIHKLINSLGILKSVNGVIQIGKESSVLHAEGQPDCRTGPVPEYCCIKIFKTTLSEYKQRDQYIKEDQRFKDRVGNQSSRKTVHIWAEKEMANLKRLQKAGIPCPEVVHLKKHLLVMSLIGEDGTPASRLVHQPTKMVDLIIAYDQVINLMKDMYTKANLIHADLSEYNILWNNGQCFIIDVSQSVEPYQENSYKLLMRDCDNVTNFFLKKRVPEVMSAEELFNSITGCKYEDTEALIAIRETTKVKPHQVNIGKEVPSNKCFQVSWETSQAEDSQPPFVDVPTA